MHVMVAGNSMTQPRYFPNNLLPWKISTNFWARKYNRKFQVWIVATFQELLFLEKYFRQTENNTMTIGLNILNWSNLWNIRTYEIRMTLLVMWQVENHTNPQKWHWFKSQNAITFWFGILLYEREIMTQNFRFSTHITQTTSFNISEP